MAEFIITTQMIKKQVKKVKNWLVPGKDELHGYWLKRLNSVHERIANQLNELLQKENIDKWMKTEKKNSSDEMSRKSSSPKKTIDH